MAFNDPGAEQRDTRDAFAEVMTRLSDAWPTSAAAREFAAAGVPVFPCVSGTKRPLTTNGFHDATTDARQVDQWWRERPEANIAMPTGAASGVVVVDVDVHGLVDGHRSMGRAGRAGLIDGWMFLVTSPSGGTHAYYPALARMQQRSWQAARSGVDFRGDGGYIVLPPSSVFVQGARNAYRLQTVNPGPTSPIDAARLRDLFDPRPTPRTIDAPASRPDTDTSRLTAWVASRQEGERNQALFWAACRLAEAA